MISVTCHECGGMAYVETYERRRTLDGPAETVRQVRCAKSWRTHVRVLAPGEEPPPFQPPRGPVPPPVRPRFAEPAMSEASERAKDVLLCTLRGMREDVERRHQPAGTVDDGLPVVGRDAFLNPKTEVKTVGHNATVHPPATRRRAMDLVFNKGCSHTKAAREAGVPLSAVNYWVKEERKRRAAEAGEAPSPVESAPVQESPVEVAADYSAPPDHTDDQVAARLMELAAERRKEETTMMTETVETMVIEPDAPADVAPTGSAPAEDREEMAAREVQETRATGPRIEDAFDTGLSFFGSMTLAKFAGLEDVDDAACVARLVFRGPARKRLLALAGLLSREVTA